MINDRQLEEAKWNYYTADGWMGERKREKRIKKNRVQSICRINDVEKKNEKNSS